jgi:hypothetical protein
MGCVGTQWEGSLLFGVCRRICVVITHLYCTTEHMLRAWLWAISLLLVDHSARLRLFIRLLPTLRIEVSTSQRLAKTTYPAGYTCIAAAVVTHVTHESLFERTLRNARIV